MVKRVTKKTKQQREICIYGYAEETRNMVQELGPSVEIWGINMAHMFLGKKLNQVKKWLQIHPRDWSSQGQKPTGYWGRPKAHFNFLQKFKGDVVMSYDEPDVPGCNVFPFERFRKKYGREYFTNSFAYLMAVAIDEKVDHIYLYGINLTAIDEYTHQRPCMEYWIGRAEQAGIKVTIPPASALVKAHTPYGLRASTSEAEMPVHVADRLSTARSAYGQASYDLSSAQAMLLEIKHWDNFLGSITQKVVGSLESIEGLTEDQQKTLSNLAVTVKETVAARFDKRRDIFSSLSYQAQEQMSFAAGRVQSEQHYLSLLGGVDYRAGALPEQFLPNPILGTDFEKPTKKAV